MRLLRPVVLVVCLVACLVGLPRPAVAQGPPPPPPPPMGVPMGVQQSAPARTGVLLVTVVDPLGAVIPNASVVLLNLEAPAATTAPAKSSSNDKGVATITDLAPGRYSVKAEFPGFEAGLLKETRIRAGENRVSLVLPLKRMEDSVTVTRDVQEAAADRALAFGSALTREQIELLSEDPEEMRRQLMSMAGPDAVLKVDSFEGQDLPPKAQIKSIRISRDQFAAENHGAFSSIDIVTQAGVGPLRSSLRTGFYDSSLDGQNPLVPQTGPGQNRNFGGSHRRHAHRQQDGRVAQHQRHQQLLDADRLCQHARWRHRRPVAQQPCPEQQRERVGEHQLRAHKRPDAAPVGRLERL